MLLFFTVYSHDLQLIRTLKLRFRLETLPPFSICWGKTRRRCFVRSRDTQPTISSNSTERTETCPHLSRGVANNVQCGAFHGLKKMSATTTTSRGACPTAVDVRVCECASHVERMCARVGSVARRRANVWGRLPRQRDESFSCS